MKKRKILSLFLSLCLLISLLPTVALAAYPDSNEAGFKLETDSYTDGVLTVSGHVKLPTAEGISSFNVVLSWDSAVLTLLKRSDANVKYTPTNSKTTYPLSIETFLINGATEEKFGVSEADLYGEAGRAGFKINLYSTGGSIAAQKTTDWVKAFAIKFEVSGKPTDASTVLNSDSLRIADPVKDADVIKGAFPANDTYTIQVQDAADPAKIYNYGKMAGNNRPETANNFMMTAPGTGTATYPGSTNSPSATTKTLDSIAVTTAPTKTTYTAGENFNPAGMVVTATYSDTSTAAVTSYTVTDGNSLTAGKTSVTISYTEGSVTKTCTQDITVNAAPKTLDSIAVTTAPTKTTYTAGENFNPAGMVVTATYSDTSTAAVTSYTVTDGNSLTAGKSTVTISYTEDGVTKTCTQAITVNAVTPPAPATLTGIAVKTAPTKVTYNEGDSFDATGMVIEATYSDSSKKNVTGYTYAPTAALTTSDTEVTISYTEGGVTKTCTQAITVNAVTPPAPATLTGIAVKTAPTKVTYNEGDSFDATGMVIEATYSDSSKKNVTGYTYAPTAALTTSDTEVTISYTEGGVTKTCTQAITVNAVTPPAPTEYTITFNGNGGTPSAGTMSTIGGKLTSLPTATRSGSYSFDGWYTAASGGTQITTAYTFSANTTVYAHWTYTGGGGSYYAPVVPDMPMLYRGCTGDAVKTLQEKLNAKGFDSGNVDGIFGAKTYAAATAFQKANGLGVDGIVGKLTWAKLYDATPVNVTPVTTQPMLRTGSRGDAVRKLQELLNAKGYTCGSVDGIFGSKTYAAVLAFQKANGLGADGIVGPLTWGKLV